MLNAKTVARRYANSLFQLSVGTQHDGSLKNGEQVLKELKSFDGLLEKHQDVKKVLVSPILSRNEKTEVLNELESYFPNTFRFLVTLIEMHRMDCFSEIVRDFEKSLEEAKGEMEVELQVGQQPTEEMLQNIKNFLEEEWKKKLNLQVKVNPDLIGGFLARGQGKTLDASLRSQLKSLEEQMAS